MNHRFSLDVVDGPAAGTSVPLVDGLVIGRSVEGLGRLGDDEELSRSHVRFSIEKGSVVVHDLGSLNGTFVNGVRIQGGTLTPADVIMIGRSTAKLRILDEDSAAEGSSDAVPGRLRDAVAELRGAFRAVDEAYFDTARRGRPPNAAVAAALEAVKADATTTERASSDGRFALRALIAAVVGGDVGEIALNRGGTDGINTVLLGMNLRRHDEIVVSDEEGDQVLACLDRVASRFGVDIRLSPLEEVPDSVGPRTRLVVCSHVGRVGGRVVDAASLSACGAPVLLEGTGAAGAVSVDVGYLGCDYYTADARAWLCGPPGVGFLWIRSGRQASLAPPWPCEQSLETTASQDAPPYYRGARRFDLGSAPPGVDAWLESSVGMLQTFGWPWLADVATTRAERLASMVAEAGCEVLPRGKSAIVCWPVDDARAEMHRLAGSGCHLDTPAPGVVRASVGGWTTDEELERLADLVGAGARV